MEEEKRLTVAELERQRKAQQALVTQKTQADLDEEQRRNEAIAIESLQQLSMPPIITSITPQTPNANGRNLLFMGRRVYQGLKKITNMYNVNRCRKLS